MALVRKSCKKRLVDDPRDHSSGLFDVNRIWELFSVAIQWIVCYTSNYN